MSLPLPINEVTAPLYKGLLEQMMDTNRPENVKIYGQCPIWVIDLASRKMREYDSETWCHRIKWYLPNPIAIRRTGLALETHIDAEDNKKLLAVIKRNIDKIERYLPGEWTGVLKQERARQAQLKK
jgi:hypothetical protein